MGRKVVFSDVELAEAKRMVAAAADARQVKVGISVVLSAEAGLTNGEVATVLQSSPATVVRMHNRVRRQATKKAPGADEATSWGGRRHAYLTWEEESAFLKPWEDQAASGGVLIVSPIHRAFELRVGKAVPPATTYRLLARHGWRKIAPDNIHPKGDLQVQESFKKRGSRTLWAKS